MRNKIFRTILVLAIFLAFLNNISCVKSSKNYPNIVLIVIDTLRADHLSIYGYPKETAPFIKKLSEKSLVFENTFSSSSWTSPATASIFTSLYPFQHKVYMTILAFKSEKKYTPNIKINKIPKEIETIPEFLKKKGYYTVGVSDNLNISKREGFEQGFDVLETYNYNEAPFITNRVLKLSQKFKSKRYFLYIHFMEPHAPYHIRDPWFYCDKNSKNDRYLKKCAYDSEIGFVDHYIEKLFKKLGWYKNTIVIITADHGEGLWTHGFRIHGVSLYKEEIHVPLIIYYPKKGHKRVKANVTTIDIFPTLRDLLGEKPSKIDSGISLFKIARNEKKYKNRMIFSHLKKLFQREIFESYSVIYNNYHLIVWKNKKRIKVFDYRKDPEERNDLYETLPKEKINYMLDGYKKFYKNSKKFKAVFGIEAVSKREMEKLKTLGYVK